MTDSSVGKTSTTSFRKEKVGFWCPRDIEEGVQKLLAEGHYQDRSKAFVDLVRQGLKSEMKFHPGTQKALATMGRLLDRDQDTILALCVEGIVSLVESNGTQMPLIYEEIMLRKNRQLPARITDKQEAS